MPLHPVTLSGRHVELAPLSQDHHDGLAAAIERDRLWDLWFTIIPKPGDLRGEIERRLTQQAAGVSLPFVAIERASGGIVGVTNYLNIDLTVPRVEIGGTWYARSVQRTPLNTEAKSLLLAHAFDTLGCEVVEFRTHFLNQRSRRAIERVGARFDGVLRHHMRMPDGTLRDTCVYSIIGSEWPAVRSHLHLLLEERD